VRGAPHDHAPPEDDGLGRLVFHARPHRDLLRYGALRANVDEIRREVWVPKEECFDLVQGRHARGSGRAMLVQERTLCGEDMFQFVFVANAPHDSLSDIGRDGGAGPISTCVFIIPRGKFQSVEPARPHALTSFPQMSDPGRRVAVCHPPLPAHRTSHRVLRWKKFPVNFTSPQTTDFPSTTWLFRFDDP
jgi:hypothetical protein